MINPMVDAEGNISTAGFGEYEKGVMQGFGYAVEALKNLRYDYPDSEGKKLRKRLKNELARDIIDRCIEAIEGDGANMIVAFQDWCYDEDAPEAEGDMTASEYLFRGTQCAKAGDA